MVLSGLMTAVPCAGTVTALTDSVSPSRSLSFVSTVMLTAVSSTVVAVSLTATGPSLTPVTVTVTVAVARAAVAVADRVAEAVRAVVVRRRRVGDGPVRVDRPPCRAPAPVTALHRQRVAVEVAVVASGPRSSAAVSSAVVAVSLTATGPSLAAVTVTRDRRRRGAAVAVADRVAEAVGAVVVRSRRVSDRPVGVDRRRAVRRDGHRADYAGRRRRDRCRSPRTAIADRRVLRRRRRVVDRDRARR